MNTKLDAKIGTKFEIELIDSLGGKIGSTYTSQLLDIRDDEHIVIASPIHESRLLLIPSGSTIRCTFLHYKLGLLAFMATVVNKEKLGNIIAINVAITSKIAKIQRRDHYRLDCMLDVKYRLLSDETPVKGADEFVEIPEYKNAYTKNISGRGACIIVDEPIERGTCLHIQISLEDGHFMETKCVAVRCVRVEEIEHSKYSVGLFFIDISHREQDAVIRYIFEKQKQLLKRND